MSILGNILWFCLGGVILSALWFIAGILLCITIIGIPFGVQCFKNAGLAAFPFGKEINYNKAGFGSLLMNVLWVLVFGWELALISAVFGCLFCVTIVGIPFGLQYFKLAQLALVPFGAQAKYTHI